MKKEITIIFADDHLRNGQTQIVDSFGNVSFNPKSVVIERPGYDKAFLDYVLYCSGICGGYGNGKHLSTYQKIKLTRQSRKQIFCRKHGWYVY